MANRTKIICTIGPSVNTVDLMIKMMQEGMNVARLNFSHGTHEEHADVINKLKEARSLLKKPLAIMIDTKGPEIRLGKLKNNQALLKKGQKWLLVKEQLEGDEERATIKPEYVLDQLKAGNILLFDDGYIATHVVSVTSEGVLVEVDDGGVIKSGKGVNIPQSTISLPAITEKDIADICFACQHKVEMIAASFVRSAEHVLEIKRLLAKENQADILVIAKIENSEGVNNFDSIVQVADGIMIARGDLGVQVPLSQVPGLQKMMIRKCYIAGKPSVTATQMLESMINNPRPTRAEASDVANAIYDSTSAVMLSGETAVGRYPLETIRMMNSIVTEAEADFNYRDFFAHHSKLNSKDIASAVTLASVTTAYNSNAKAIYVFTNKGGTARLVSRLRPSIPIVAFTSNEKCYHQLASNWGVIPILCEEFTNIKEAWSVTSKRALKEGLLNFGDLVLIIAGSPFGVSGTTNMMIVESIGDILLRGISGVGEIVSGHVAIVVSPELEQPELFKDKILVLTECNLTYLPLIKESSGVILQNYVEDLKSEAELLEIAKSLNKSVIVRAVGIQQLLKEGQLVTLDPQKAFVYNTVT